MRLRSGAYHAKTTDEYVQKLNREDEIPDRKACSLEAMPSVYDNFDFTIQLHPVPIEPLLKETQSKILVINQGPPITRETLQSLISKDRAKSFSRSRSSTSDSLAVETLLDFDFLVAKYNLLDGFANVHYWIINNPNNPFAKIYYQQCRFDAILVLTYNKEKNCLMEFVGSPEIYYYHYQEKDSRLDEQLSITNEKHNLWTIIQKVQIQFYTRLLIDFEQIKIFVLNSFNFHRFSLNI